MKKRECGRGPHEDTGQTARRSERSVRRGGTKKRIITGHESEWIMQLPSQTRLLYTTGAISNGNFTQTNLVNLPKDLSVVNRRGYEHTSRKGVPYVFAGTFTVYPSGLDGSGYVTNTSSDVRTTIKCIGVQNSWVAKNAAVKWQKALESMRKKAGIRKKDVGTYAKTIRYGWNTAGQTWSNSVDGEGNEFTGGTWDYTRFADSQDSSYGLKLSGLGVDSSGATSVVALNALHSYLASRRQPDTDSNEGADLTPSAFNHLNDLLVDDDHRRRDEIEDFVKDDGDNVPYEPFSPATVNHDVTEPAELGRVTMTPQGSGASVPMSCYLHIPFGIMEVLAAHRDPDDNSGIVDDLCWSFDLDVIYEMQG